jgi:hypothetical protein
MQRLTQPSDLTQALSSGVPRAYWIALKEYMAEHGFAGFESRKPRPQHWFQISSGRTGFRLAAKVNSAKNRIGVELYI